MLVDPGLVGSSMSCSWVAGVALLASSLVLGCFPARGQEQSGFQVIVNRVNPVESVSRAQLSGYFLKPHRRWPSGLPVAPIDQLTSSSVRERFSVKVHGRPVRAVRAHWQRLIFQGRGVPPPMASSEHDVVEFVAQNANAVGYVGNLEEGAGVKVVALIE